MNIFRITIFVFCFNSLYVNAGTINCEPASGGWGVEWQKLHTPYELTPSTLTMTLGSNIPDWTVLYTVNAPVGESTGSCDKVTYMYFTLFTQAQPIEKHGDDFIYSTNIPGIGISIEESQVHTSAQPYPSVIYWGATSEGYGFWATVKFWKIPGNIPMTNGPFTVTGPEAGIVYKYSGYSFTSSESDRITSDSLSYITSSKILTLTMMFQPGTCNIEGDNIKVNIGDYVGGNSYSEWKDANFKLVCQNGMGYNGRVSSGDEYNNPTGLSPSAEVTANNKMNGRVQISVVPYTEVIDANRGIIALDGTGATGYGIQLAWGDYSTQSSTEPTNPVILNSYVDANSLNSGFGAGDTPIGGNAFTGTDNTIKMAARYIRTTGKAAPGPANAVVQVIANYQ